MHGRALIEHILTLSLSVCVFYYVFVEVWLSVDPFEMELIRVKRMIYSALSFKYWFKCWMIEKFYYRKGVNEIQFRFKHAKWYLFRAMIALSIAENWREKNRRLKSQLQPIFFIAHRHKTCKFLLKFTMRAAQDGNIARKKHTPHITRSVRS